MQLTYLFRSSASRDNGNASLLTSNGDAAIICDGVNCTLILTRSTTSTFHLSFHVGLPDTHLITLQLRGRRQNRLQLVDARVSVHRLVGQDLVHHQHRFGERWRRFRTDDAAQSVRAHRRQGVVLLLLLLLHLVQRRQRSIRRNAVETRIAVGFVVVRIAVVAVAARSGGRVNGEQGTVRLGMLGQLQYGQMLGRSRRF